MSKKPITFKKPLTFVATENQDSINRTQLPSKKSYTTFRRSLSQNDIKTVDLTLDDDDEVPKKRPKLGNDANKETDIKKLLLPKTSDDLVIHAKKIQEVKGWFEEMKSMKNRNPMLLVTGPCGSGKLTTVKVVAEENGYDCDEYSAPLDFEVPEAYEYEDMRDNRKASKQGQAEHLVRFLRQASRFGTIFSKTKKKKVIVCKDIPNVFSEDPILFQKVLEDYSRSGRSPLIFITNDTKGKQLNLNYKLFNDETMAAFKIAQITFNPVSYMQINKHLKGVAAKMALFKDSYNIPSSETIESIIVSSQGDLRNATINLLFACQKGAVSMKTDTEMSKLTEKKQAKKYKDLGTDETVTMMHLLGKVFNPKLEQKEGLDTLTNNPESLTDMFSTQANTCLKMIFVNYADHFSRMTDLSSAADLLSISDVLMNEWRDDQLSMYGLNIGIRGTMVTNTDPIVGYKGKIRGFKNIFHTKNEEKKPQTSVLELMNPFKSWTSEDLPKSTYVCDCKTYANIIKSNPNHSLLGFDVSEFDDEIQKIEDFSDDDDDL